MRYLGFLSLLLVLVLVGCGQSHDVDSGVTESLDAKAVPQVAMLASAPASPTEGNRAAAQKPAAFIVHRDVIHKAQISVRVKDIEAAEKRIGALTENVGGYLDSASSTDLASDHPQVSLTLRVPVSSFDPTLESIESLGTPLSKTIESEDVTGQLIDLEARVKTMAAEEDTYRALLRQARSLSAMIELQDKLTDLRGQIESIAAQRKEMSELAAMSKVDITLTQDAVAVAAPVDRNWLSQSWASASSFTVAVGRVMATVAIWIIALFPFWVTALAIGMRVFKHLNRTVATSPAMHSTIQ